MTGWTKQQIRYWPSIRDEVVSDVWDAADVILMSNFDATVEWPISFEVAQQMRRQFRRSRSR